MPVNTLDSLSADLEESLGFNQNFFKIDNEKMHYVEQGEGEKVVLLLHGNPTWSYYYRNLIKDLSTDFKVYSLDHLNCGLSSRSEKFWRLEDRIRHVEKFIREKKLENVTLVGHDWGGAIATGTAIRIKDKLKNLILMNTACFFSEDIPKRIALCRLPILGKFLNKTINGFLKASFVMGIQRRFSSEEKKAYLFPYREASLRKGIDDFVKDIPMSEKHPSRKTLDLVEEEARKLKIPVLLLWGAKDFCFNLGFFERIKNIFPHAKSRVFENANHYVLEDETENCIKEIREFLK